MKIVKETSLNSLSLEFPGLPKMVQENIKSLDFEKAKMLETFLSEAYCEGLSLPELSYLLGPAFEETLNEAEEYQEQ